MREVVTGETEETDGADAATRAGVVSAGDATGDATGEAHASDGARGKSEARRSPSVLAAARARLFERGEFRAAALLVLAALALRLLALGVENVLTPDGVYYAMLGRHFVEGKFAQAMHPYWPPLYPLLVAFAAFFARDVELAGRLVSVVAGALTVLPTYALARGAYGRRVASTAALLVALHPLLVYYSTMVLTEATYTLAFASAVALGWRALDRWRARDFALTGLAFGACYLMKPEAAGYVVLVLALVAGVKLFGRSRPGLEDSPPRRGALAQVSALVAGFALLAVPYVVYLRGELGRWTISGKLSGHILQGDTGPMAGVPTSTWLVQLTKALRYEYEVLNLIFPVTFVVFAALGLFRSAWSRGRARRELYLMVFCAAALAGYAVSVANIRFFVPLLPLALVWVAKGIWEGEDWLGRTLGERRRRAVRLLKPLAVVALALSLVPLFVYLMRGDKWGDYGGQKRAAAFIKARHAGQEPPPLVMATVPLTAFYAVSRHTKLETYETLDEVMARVRREGVNYLVVNARELRNSPTRSLLDETAEHPGLRLVFKHEDGPGLKVLVYAPADAPTP